MNNAFVSFILNIPIKIGLKKEKRVGITMNNVSNITMKGIKTEGYDKGIEIKNASNLKGEDFNIK